MISSMNLHGIKSAHVKRRQAGPTAWLELMVTMDDGSTMEVCLFAHNKPLEITGDTMLKPTVADNEGTVIVGERTRTAEQPCYLPGEGA